MSPWEEDEDEFPQDVCVGHVKVVLQGGDVDELIELDELLASKQLSILRRMIIRSAPCTVVQH